MNDALQAIFDDLEANRDRFLDLLSGLDDAQLSFRPRPDSWSALDVAEHVLLAEQISTLPHVAHTSTYVAMEAVKEGGL